MAIKTINGILKEDSTKTVEEFKLRYDDEPKDSAFKKKEIRIKNLYHYVKNPEIQKQ